LFFNSYQTPIRPIANRERLTFSSHAVDSLRGAEIAASLTEAVTCLFPVRTFLHQGQAQHKNYRFHNWNSTGAMLLAFAQPLRKLYVTAKVADLMPHVTKATAASLIEDGRGFSRRHKEPSYANRSDDQLFTALASWSPVVRQRAVDQLRKRKCDFKQPRVGNAEALTG